MIVFVVIGALMLDADGWENVLGILAVVAVFVLPIWLMS